MSMHQVEYLSPDAWTLLKQLVKAQRIGTQVQSFTPQMVSAARELNEKKLVELTTFQYGDISLSLMLAGMDYYHLNKFSVKLRLFASRTLWTIFVSALTAVITSIFTR